MSSDKSVTRKVSQVEEPNEASPVSLPYYPFYKTLLWFLYFFVFCTTNAVIAKRIFVFADSVQLNYIYPPLFDLGHTLDQFISPIFQPHVLWLPDFLFAINLFVFCASLLWVPQRNRIAAIFLKLWGTLFAMRGLVMPLTQLPTPIESCRDPNLTQLPSLRDSRTSYIPTGSMFCNDFIFSGHSTINLLCCFFWCFSTFPMYMKVISVIYTAFALLTTIFTRDHYTVDVVLAIYIAGLLTWHYKEEIILYYKASMDHTNTLWDSFFPPEPQTNTNDTKDTNDNMSVTEKVTVISENTFATTPARLSTSSRVGRSNTLNSHEEEPIRTRPVARSRSRSDSLRKKEEDPLLSRRRTTRGKTT